jgi:hypothetical protein
MIKLFVVLMKPFAGKGAGSLSFGEGRGEVTQAL